MNQHHASPPSGRLPCLALASCVFASFASAQWAANPAVNLPVGDRFGDQAVPKIAAAADGGCYIGWFDNGGSGYEVRLQRLDVHGVEQWAHNGIVVSNNPQNSSLVDWDLIADAQGNCVLTFTDVRSGPDLDVYAYRIDPTGAQLWGPNGVTLSANGDSENNPHVCQTSIGDFAFTWSNNTNFTLRLQRLDQAGVPLYAADGIGIPGDAGANPAFVHIVAGDGGSVILGWVRTLAFTGNKHLHAQKFDVAGNALWNGGTRLPVFDQTSLPIAHDPRLLPDGLGGAVFGWHFAVGSVFSVRVQHVDAAGTELFGHNGVDVSTNANSKFDPAVTFDVPTQQTTVVWNERNTAQSLWGISAQRFDALGVRQWGAAGVTLLPIDTVNKLAPVSVPFRDGVMAFVLAATGPVTKKVIGMRIDGTGAMQWLPAVDVGTFVGDKLRLQAAVSRSGLAMLAWAGDGRVVGDSTDIIAQAIGANGVLPPTIGTVALYGCGVNPTGSLTVSGRPGLGGGVATGIDNPAGTQAVGSLPILAIATAALPGFPCGVAVPGLGMSSPGANGELLVDLGTVVEFRFGPPWAGAGLPSMIPIDIPVELAFVGVPLFFQGALFDGSPGAAIPLALADAASWVIGF